MAESDSDSDGDSDAAKETTRGTRPAPSPILGGVSDGPEQLVRNIEAHIRLLEPASRADFRRRLAASRSNISALTELNQAVATAAEENEAADRASPEPEPTPIDREAHMEVAPATTKSASSTKAAVAAGAAVGAHSRRRRPTSSDRSPGF